VKDRSQKNRLLMNGILNFQFGTRGSVPQPSLQAMIHHHTNNENEKTFVYDQLMVYSNSELNTDVCQVNSDDEESSLTLFPSIQVIQETLKQANHSYFDHAKWNGAIYDKQVNQYCVLPKRDMYLMQIMGQQYVVCVNPDTRLPHVVIGHEVMIQMGAFSPGRTVEWLKSTVLQKVKQVCEKSQLESLLTNGQLMNHTTTTTTTTTATGTEHRREAWMKMSMANQQRMMNNPWFTVYEDSCRFKWTRDPVVCEHEKPLRARAAEPKQKVCIFLHGVGNSDDISGPPVHEFPDYWGNVHEYTPQCSERWFIREETKKRGWDDKDLQRAFCQLALINETRGDNIIRDKVLFVHSMGNLILSGAIRDGFCDIDNETTSWYEIQGPFAGSKAAGELETICLFMYNGEWISHFSPRFVKWVATTGGYCVPGTNHSYPAYDTLGPGYPGLHGLREIAEPRMKGAMCGDSAYGLNSIYSAALLSLSVYVGYGDVNDGMVPWKSCQSGKQNFSYDFKDSYYLATINHADGTCRNGNGVWGSFRQPCSWYTDKL